jgi:hypothetical protein
MDGASRLKLQEKKGIRPIIEDIDNCRILLGFSNVTVHTPKVETRLRYLHNLFIDVNLIIIIFLFI